MNAAALIGQTAASCADMRELQEVMTPFSGMPVVTPDMMQAALVWLLARIHAMQSKAAAPATAGEAKYLPASTLGKRYGMTQKGIAPYLLRWTRAGKIQKIAPINPQTGRPGRPRYSVQEVDKMMEEQCAIQTQTSKH